MKMWWICFVFLLAILQACNSGLPAVSGSGGDADVFPDYRGVTIPVNIAPLNFVLKGDLPAIAVFSAGKQHLKINSKNGHIAIAQKAWQQLLKEAAGDSLCLKLYQKQDKGWHAFNSFFLYVASDRIDSYLVYRRIAPGYRMWSEMGIYQRNLETFDEQTILNNKRTDNNCMNCHSFCMQSPDKMLFHQRSVHAGTYLLNKGEVKKLAPKKEGEPHSLVYPYWHPSEKFVAFSSNSTKQDFHLSSANRIEVFDQWSDIYLYDVKTEALFTSPLLSSKENMETFPAFSPDGERLYYCSAPAQLMPEAYDKIKYNLVSLAFNPETRAFSEKADTLYNAPTEGRSAKFPRISPDGKFLMYTVSDYGNFSIWHKDADLCLVDLNTRKYISLDGVNSDDVESYHSWSSNSNWFVFSSRRGDGLYTRPYICYIDKNGKVGKPFLLPQKDPDYYTFTLFSFNIPELVKAEVAVSSYKLLQATLKE